jgi:adenylate cyclase
MKHNRSEESFYYRTKALELAPNHPRSHLGFSDLYFNWGEAEKAKHAITRAIHLDPYPPDVYFHHLGRVQLQLGEVDDAIATLERTEANPVMAGFLLAAALAKAGRKAEAKAMTRKFCQALPHWTISRWIENEFLRHDKDVKFWQATFRLAGLPE